MEHDFPKLQGEVVVLRRDLNALVERVGKAEADVVRVRKILVGDPTEEEIAQGKQLGIVGMLAKGERDREKLRRVANYMAYLLTGGALLNAPDALPKFFAWVGGAIKHLVL